MTSRQFSANKKAAEYDFKLSLKNLIIPTVLTFISSLIMFVISPLNSVFSLYFNTRFNIEQLRKEVVLALTNMMFGEYAGLCFLFFGMLYAIISFGFIMNKKAVNVFFSTSVDRRTIYKNRILASVLMIASATAIPILVDIIINILFLGNAGYVIICGLTLFAGTFVYTLTGFAIMSVAMILCSTFFEAVLFGVAAVGAPSVAVYFVDSFCTAFLKGYYHNDLLNYYAGTVFAQPSLFHYTSIINPLLMGKACGAQHSIGDNIFNFVYRVNNTNDWMSAGTVFNGYEKLTFDYVLPFIVWAAISVGLICIARGLFIKFKAENAGVHGSSVFASRFFVVVCMIALCAFWVDAVSFVYDDLSRVANIVVTVVIGALLMLIAYFILISICRRTAHHSAREFAVPASAIAGVIVFTCILSTGAFGYSTYVPESDKIDRAIITTNITDMSASEFTTIPTEDSYYEDIFPDYHSGNAAIGIFDDEEDLKLFTDINKDLVKKTDNMTGNGVCVYYMLKDGSVVSRFYDSTDYDASYRILSLRDSKAVKDELNYLFTGKINDTPAERKTNGLSFGAEVLFSYSSETDAARVIQGGRIYAVSSDGIMNGNLIKNTPELRQALLNDLLSQTYEQRFKPNEAAIGGLFFSSNDYLSDDNSSYYYTVETLLEQELGEDVYYSSFEGGYYIYPSMTNTVNYLKSTGEYDLFAPKEDEILSISIEKCGAVRAKQFESWGSDATISYQFATLNQLYTNIDDLIEDEIDYDVLDSDGYNVYYNMQMTIYFNDGVTVDKNNEIAELMAKSKNYYYVNEDDCVIMVHYKNKGYVSMAIPADDVPDWVFNQNVNV